MSEINTVDRKLEYAIAHAHLGAAEALVGQGIEPVSPIDVVTDELAGLIATSGVTNALEVIAERSSREDAYAIQANRSHENSPGAAIRHRAMSKYWTAVAVSIFAGDTDLQATYHASREIYISRLLNS